MINKANQVRRCLLKGGLTQPVIFGTLLSKPVLGNAGACVTPSGMISGNLSGFRGIEPCSGMGRSHWYSELNQLEKKNWPSWATLNFQDELVIKAIPYASLQGTEFQSGLVGDIFIDSYRGGDSNLNCIPGFASYIIAAYVNAMVNPTVRKVFTQAQAIQAWNSIITTGTYSPIASGFWNSEDIINYFENSGIVSS